MTKLLDEYPTFHRVVGIDLGTSTCAISVWDGAKLLVVRGPTGASSMLASVGLDAHGQVIAGVPPGGDPGNVVAGIKRRLGSGDRVRFRGRLYLPRDICAFLLIELKRQAETFVGELIHDAVITVSAAAGEAQRRALREAAGLAQLNVRRLVEDPVAAAMVLGVDAPPGLYAVYDLGGGTFDASIVRVVDGTAEVLGTAGDQLLGGDDFDERIVGYALREIRDRHHVDLSQDRVIRQRMRWEAETRKRELSAAETTMLELPVLTATVSARVPLSRRTFEAMIEPDVQRSLDLLGEAIAAARATHGVGWGDIDQVVLAGGSTRIPAIRERLAAYLGWGPARIRTDLDPDEMVARGAGLVARDYEPASLFEGSPVGLLSASLRLRAEMAVPQAGPSGDEPPETPDPPGPSGPPAETPADFRHIAEQAYMLLLQDGELSELADAYSAFIAAVQAAAPDVRLALLGEALTSEYARASR